MKQILEIFRALAAAQVALLDYEKSDVNDDTAQTELILCLTIALEKAKNLT
jgi:hypothetical protein